MRTLRPLCLQGEAAVEAATAEPAEQAQILPEAAGPYYYLVDTKLNERHMPRQEGGRNSLLHYLQCKVDGKPAPDGSSAGKSASSQRTDNARLLLASVAEQKWPNLLRDYDEACVPCQLACIASASAVQLSCHRTTQAVARWRVMKQRSLCCVQRRNDA